MGRNRRAQPSLKQSGKKSVNGPQPVRTRGEKSETPDRFRFPVDTGACLTHKPASMTLRAAPSLAFALLLLGTTLGLAGTDLVLPAVPGLPEALGGTAAMAQLVLAAFVAGGCIGLILFGLQFGEFLSSGEQMGLIAFGGLLIAAGYSVASLTVGTLFNDKAVWWHDYWTVQKVRRAIRNAKHVTATDPDSRRSATRLLRVKRP